MCSRVRVVYRITASAEGPGDARSVIDAECGELVPQPVLESAKLLVSEFVTSRIVSGAADRDEPIILDVRTDGTVRCTMIDRAPATLPPKCVLGVVERLADEWGLTRSSDMTLFWFETGGENRGDTRDGDTRDA
jgi:hypothetical protein